MKTLIKILLLLVLIYLIYNIINVSDSDKIEYADMIMDEAKVKLNDFKNENKFYNPFASKYRIQDLLTLGVNSIYYKKTIVEPIYSKIKKGNSLTKVERIVLESLHATKDINNFTSSNIFISMKTNYRFKVFYYAIIGEIYFIIIFLTMKYLIKKLKK